MYLALSPLNGERIESIKEIDINIYVGNLSHSATDDDLRAAFEPFGTVSSATVVKDRYSGESRGFGFVEMPGKTEAINAIRDMNGAEHMGRSLIVNEARPRSEAPRGGGSGGGHRRPGGGGGFGGGGGGGRRF